MLSQLTNLTQEADGRYATDAELMFLQNYLKTARLRFSAYQKLQAAETAIVQTLTTKLKAMDPSLLQVGNKDQTQKCQRDAVQFLRYIAQALLIDDPESLQEHFLSWLQTIIRGLKHERNARASYVLMEELIQQHLTAQEASLVSPLMESARSMLLSEN